LKRIAKRSPLPEQEGWLRIKKYRGATFESADGVVSPRMITAAAPFNGLMARR